MKNYQKKIIASSLAIIMLLLSFSGCDNDDNKKKPSKGQIISSKVENTDDTSSDETLFPTDDGESSYGEDDSLYDDDFFDDDESEETTIVNMSVYESFPNDGKDDSSAIRTAIREAGSLRKHVTIEFAPGVYNIDTRDPNAPRDAYFFTMFFRDLKNVTIKGDNTTFLISHPIYAGFKLKNCENFTFEGISIDYSVDPWAQGKVIAIDKDAATLTIKVNNLRNGKSVMDYEECWAEIPGRTYLDICFGMIREDDNPLLFKKNTTNGNYFKGMEKATKISEDVYKVSIARKMPNGSDCVTIDMLGTDIVVGSNIILNARGGGNAFFIEGGKDFTVKNCNVYATPGAINKLAAVDGDILFDNFNVLLKDGRWTTNNADGCFADNLRAKLTIKNCTWEGLSDDVVNLHTQSGRVVKIDETGAIVGRIKQAMLPQIGDVIQILDPTAGRIRGEATVTSVDKTYDNGYYDIRLVLDRTIKFVRADDKIIVKDMQASGTVIENNVFRYGRNKGLKINSLNTLIRGNVFEHISYAAITIHDYNYQFNENGCVDHCIIENNKMVNTAYLHVPSIYCAPITVYGTNTAGNFPLGYFHTNIKILNNEITNVYNSGIYINNAAKVTISGNKITGLATDGENGNAGIFLNTVKQVKITGNTITDPRHLMAGILIQARAGKNITYTDNIFNLATGVTTIDDRRSASNR